MNPQRAGTFQVRIGPQNYYLPDYADGTGLDFLATTLRRGAQEAREKSYTSVTIDWWPEEVPAR